MTPNEIVDAVEALGALEFFPTDPGARKQIMRLLDRMVSDTEQLRWLVRTMVDHVGEWHGPTELRGVFCTRYRPKDGMDAVCVKTHGFRGCDMEERAIEAASEAKRIAPNIGLMRALLPEAPSASLRPASAPGCAEESPSPTARRKTLRELESELAEQIKNMGRSY